MVKIVTENPLNAEIDWAALAQPVTPTPSFFKRNHNEFPACPAHIEVNGRQFTLDELKGMGAAEFEATMECAGNARQLFDPLPPGTAWGIGAVSNGRWKGVNLLRVLEHAPAPADCCELVFESLDGDGEMRYARSLPPDQFAHAWLVWEMNGEPLSAQHGAPLRLVVPGWYGMASVKWLHRIYSVSTPFQGYYQVEDYQFQPREGPSRPLSRMLVKSLIISPTEGQSCGSSVELRGWAWTGEGQVDSVTVEVDGTPHLATLEPDRGPYCWRGWGVTVELPAGEHTAIAFAHDTAGRTQPLQALWNKQGYENNSAHQVSFRSGER